VGIRPEPDDAQVFDSRGVAYGYKKQYDLTLLDFNEAIRLTPDDARAFTNRGYVYLLKRDYTSPMTSLANPLSYVSSLVVETNWEGISYRTKSRCQVSS
jgi:Flp pilus assembly protein TadD